MNQHYSDPSRANDKWSLPDSDAFGPYETRQEAIDAAQEELQS